MSGDGPARETVGALFVDAAATHGERVFLRSLDAAGQEESCTYAEAARRVAAAVLDLDQRLGLRRGDRVVGYLDDMVASVMFQVACAHLGVTTVYLSPLFSLELLARIAARIEARAVFTSAARSAEVAAAGLLVCAYAEPGARLPPGVHPIDPRADLDPAGALEVLRRASAATTGDDVYIMQPTSGSTGEPKLAMRTHRSIVRSAHRHAVGLRPADEPPQRLLMVASLTHAFGQSILASAIWLGAEVSVPDAVDVDCSLDVVRRLDPTYLLMPPRVLRALHRQQVEHADPAARQGSLFGPSARHLQFTGAPGDVELLRMLESQGVNVIEMYGSTETGQIAMTRPGQWAPGAVGPPLPDVTLRIADDGELLARSPGRMIGYFGDPALTAEAFTEDGFYRTGDYAELTDQGLLRILGRKRDVFNTPDGANIYPGRIESMIEALPWVHQVVLVGDQRPFVAALLVVAPGEGRGEDPDGLLDPMGEPETHATARADLAALNHGLEPNERVRRFLLFGRQMPPGVCDRANLGKVRRDRRAVVSTYGPRIERIYAAAELGGRTVSQEDQ